MPTFLQTTFSALTVKNYRLLWFSSLVSLMGVWLHRVAESWMVLDLTDSPSWVGTIGFLAFAPMLFLAPWGGLLGDRFPKRWVLVFTQTTIMLFTAMLAILAFSGQLVVWHIAALALINGLVMSIDMPCRQAFMVEVVGKSKIQSAIGLNSVAFNAARAIGPMIGGVILLHSGPAWCFAFNAFSSLFVITALLLMKGLPTLGHESARKKGAFLEGMRYLKSNRMILSHILILSTLAVLIYPYVNQLPVFTRDVLHLDADGFGLLMSLIGVGAVIGSLTGASLATVSARARLILLLPWLFVPGLMLFSLSDSLWLTRIALIMLSFGTTATMAAVNSNVQILVSDDMRSRVMGTYSSAFAGIFPYGVLLAGFLSEHLGVQHAFFGYAVASALVLTTLFIVFRSQWAHALSYQEQQDD